MAVSKRYVRWVNIALGTLFLLPVATAFFFYQGGARYLGRMNKGTLVTPLIASSALAIRDEDKNPVTLDKKWTILYRAKQCDKACEKVMDKILRVRLALGRDMSRTQAALLSDEKVGDTLSKQMRDVRGLDTKALLSSLNNTVGLAAHQIYLVDPKGYIMMRYNAGVAPKAIYSDLGRLLKVSKIG